MSLAARQVLANIRKRRQPANAEVAEQAKDPRQQVMDTLAENAAADRQRTIEEWGGLLDLGIYGFLGWMLYRFTARGAKA
jgi:hypothetical protein